MRIYNGQTCIPVELEYYYEGRKYLQVQCFCVCACGAHIKWWNPDTDSKPGLGRLAVLTLSLLTLLLVSKTVLTRAGLTKWGPGSSKEGITQFLSALTKFTYYLLVLTKNNFLNLLAKVNSTYEQSENLPTLDLELSTYDETIQRSHTLLLAFLLSLKRCSPFAVWRERTARVTSLVQLRCNHIYLFTDECKGCSRVDSERFWQKTWVLLWFHHSWLVITTCNDTADSMSTEACKPIRDRDANLAYLNITLCTL